MTEVVDAELHLVAVVGLPLRHRHQPGVVHEQVDLRVLLGDRVRGGLDRRLTAEVERDQLDRRRRVVLQDPRLRRRRLVLVAHRHDDVSALAGECLGGLEAEPPIGAGDDGDASGLIGDVGDGPRHARFIAGPTSRGSSSDGLTVTGSGYRPPGCRHRPRSRRSCVVRDLGPRADAATGAGVAGDRPGRPQPDPGTDRERQDALRVPVGDRSADVVPATRGTHPPHPCPLHLPTQGTRGGHQTQPRRRRREEPARTDPGDPTGRRSARRPVHRADRRAPVRRHAER